MKNPAKRSRKGNASMLLRNFNKSTILFLVPVIFFLGGSMSIIVFASVVLVTPVQIPISKIHPRNRIAYTAPPPGEAVLGKSIVRKEARPLILKKYLQAHSSPLANQADFLIETAEKYDMDWRLLPAIAGQESTFCRTIPEDSYNCWGWGVHSRGTKKFETWEGAIETVAKGIKENYIDQGYSTPEEMMKKYCPRSITEAGGSWAEGIKYFIWEMDNF